MPFSRVLFLFLHFCLSLTIVTAQDQAGLLPINDSDAFLIVRLKGDSKLTYVCKIIEKRDNQITIMTDEGSKIQLNLSNIEDIQVIPRNQIHNGVYRFSNPFDFKYLIGPSAFNLKKGESYYQTAYLLLHSINWGITDEFSIGIGFELISLLVSGGDGALRDTEPVYFITPKYRIQVSEDIQLGIGVHHGKLSDYIHEFSVGYGLVTYGNPEHNASLGLGFGYFDYGGGEVGFKSEPVITVSGMTRISKRVSLVTENWLYPADSYRGYSGISTYGFRILWENMSLEVALVNNDEIVKDVPIGVPYIGFVKKF